MVGLFRSPGSVAVTADGTIVVADTMSNTIRCVDVDGNVTTIAGGIYGQGDLAAGRPSFRRPEAVAAETHWSPAQSTGRLRTCGPS